MIASRFRKVDKYLSLPKSYVMTYSFFYGGEERWRAEIEYVDQKRCDKAPNPKIQKGVHIKKNGHEILYNGCIQDTSVMFL